MEVDISKNDKECAPVKHLQRSSRSVNSSKNSLSVSCFFVVVVFFSVRKRTVDAEKMKTLLG